MLTFNWLLQMLLLLSFLATIHRSIGHEHEKHVVHVPVYVHYIHHHHYYRKKHKPKKKWKKHKGGQSYSMEGLLRVYHTLYPPPVPPAYSQRQHYANYK